MKLMNPNESFDAAYAGLNPEQRAAVDEIYGPVMVVAGPGTGKTQIIALRTANIVLRTGARPENILLTTFTEAGVASMRKRLVSILGEDGYRVAVHTFHAFCTRVMEEYPEYFGSMRLDRSVDDLERYEMIESILDSVAAEHLRPIGDPYRYVRSIVGKIDTLKQENVTPAWLRVAATRQAERYVAELAEIKPTLKKYETTKEKQARHLEKLEELATIYAEYQKRLREQGCYDYADMIRFVAEALDESEALAAALRERYQFMMVDEYQDTNSLQNHVMHRLASYGDEPNLLVVGDDDQSIYRFQGANIENMLEFAARYPGAKTVVLSRNYRSAQSILDLASRVIANNSERIVNRWYGIEKNLVSARDGLSAEVATLSAGSETEEICAVLAGVREELARGTEPAEIAVIVRDNATLARYSEFFRRQGIAVESRTDANALDNPFVKLLISVAKLVDNPFAGSGGFLDLLRSGLFGTRGSDAIRLAHELHSLNYTRRRPLSLYDLVSNEDTLAALPLQDVDSVRHTRNFIDAVQALVPTMPVGELLREIVARSSLIPFLERHATIDDIESVYAFLQAAEMWNERSRGATLHAILEKVEAYARYGLRISRVSVRPGTERVRILTAHTSKGLEYEAVWVPRLAEKVWNDRRDPPDIAKIPDTILGLESDVFDTTAREDEKLRKEEEDRRLFFVAVTRAKRRLTLSYALASDDSRQARVESRYLAEAGISAERCAPMADVASVLLADMGFSAARGEFGPDEEAFARNFFESYRLSHSDLETFLEDPRAFFRRVILRAPFESNVHTKFGSAYHRALENFAREYKKSGHRPSAEFLASSFAKSLSQEILSPEEYDRLLARGTEGIVGWHREYGSRDPVPLEIEYSLSRKEISIDGVPVSGKIDAILPGSDDRSVLLIDYKTGATKTENALRGLTASDEPRYFRQVMMYRLMIERDPRFAGKRVETAIEFAEWRDGKYARIPLEATDEELAEFRSLLVESWAKITSMDFWRETLADDGAQAEEK